MNDEETKNSNHPYWLPLIVTKLLTSISSYMANKWTNIEQILYLFWLLQLCRSDVVVIAILRSFNMVQFKESNQNVLSFIFVIFAGWAFPHFILKFTSIFNNNYSHIMQMNSLTISDENILNEWIGQDYNSWSNNDLITNGFKRNI